MFPETLNTSDNKKVSELWKDEKKYRWWIFSFPFALFILFSFHIALLVNAYIFESSLLIHFAKYSEKVGFPEDQFLSLVWSLIGMAVGLLICITLFSYSIYNSYKAKSFEKLDSVSTFFLGFQTFFSFITLFQTFIASSSSNFGIISGNMIMILSFALKFLLIPVWLLLSREVKKIKRTFFIAKRQEEIKAFYEANQNGNGSNQGYNPYQQQPSPFGFPFQNKPKQENNPGAVNNPVDSEPKDERIEKLSSMSIEELRGIADKLSISGNSEMEKSQLVKTIISVSDSLKTNDNQISDEENKDSNDLDLINNNANPIADDSDVALEEPKVKKEAKPKVAKVKKESKPKVAKVKKEAKPKKDKNQN
ncbi:MAG: hypothetical protein KFW07_04170 [Mycoplasmataceae bacterium]|nr:hypothetical protein [Mycoplasmataceae bacterium]